MNQKFPHNFPIHTLNYQLQLASNLLAFSDS